MNVDLTTRYDGGLERTADLGEMVFAGTADGQPVTWDWDAFAVAQAHHAGLGLTAPVETS